jgi:hypothetical protein
VEKHRLQQQHPVHIKPNAAAGAAAAAAATVVAATAAMLAVTAILAAAVTAAMLVVAMMVAATFRRRLLVPWHIMNLTLLPIRVWMVAATGLANRQPALLGTRLERKHTILGALMQAIFWPSRQSTCGTRSGGSGEQRGYWHTRLRWPKLPTPRGPRQLMLRHQAGLPGNNMRPPKKKCLSLQAIL